MNVTHFFSKMLVGTLLLMTAIVAVPFGALASTIAFTPPTITVTEGDTFKISVFIDAAGKPAYTVKVAGNFTPGLLRLSEWTYANAWIALRQPGYDSFDNNAGTFERTAGYSGGFAGRNLFATATFTAVKVGKATIKTNTGTFAYDASSQNTMVGGSEVRVEIIPRTQAPAVEKPVEKDHAFSVALEVLKSAVETGENVPVMVRVAELGDPKTLTKDITVPLRYTLLNSDGLVVNEETAKVTFKASTDFKHEFKTTSLKTGKYFMTVAVEYPNQTSPAKATGEVQIGREEAPVVAQPQPIVPEEPLVPIEYLWILIALLGAFILWLLVRRHQHQNEHHAVHIEHDVVRRHRASRRTEEE